MATMSRTRKMKIDTCLVMSVCVLLPLAGAGSPGGTDPSGMTLRCAWGYASSCVDVTGAVSSDGRYIALEDKTTGGLAIHDLISGQDRHLTHNETPGEEGLSHAEISRDGNWVVYSWRHQDGTVDLRLISIDGSQDRVLFQHEDVIRIEPEGWSPDGRNVLARITRRDQTHQIALISPADGSLQVLKDLGSRQDGAAHLSLSPDGRFIAFDFHPTDDSSQENISVLSIDGASDTPLLEHPGDDNVLGWPSNGKWVLFREDRSGADEMWAIQVTADGKPKGQPQLIQGNIGGCLGRGATDDGCFYYETGTNPVDTCVASLDLDTAKVTDPKRASGRPRGETRACQWSPDGKYLLYTTRFQRWSPRAPRMLVIRSMETGQEREIALPPESRAVGYSMPWSPDGRSILISCEQSSSPLRWELYRLDLATGETTSVVPPSAGVKYPVGWSADGRKIYFMREEWDPIARKFKNGCILAHSLETGQDEEMYRTENSGLGRVVLSPDHQQLAFASGEQPTARVLMILPAAGGKAREVLREREGDIDPQRFAWTPDGRDLLFLRRPRGYLLSDWEELLQIPAEMWRIPVAGGERQRLELAPGGQSVGQMCVHPDGKQIAFTRWDLQNRELWVMKSFLPD